jgi:lipopolysaccharide export LptBFGC system permease protein LptF
MSWERVYRMALHLLPAGLRQKHGHAMETLFARELAQARTQGRLQSARVGVVSVWDVVRRATYEQLRSSRHVVKDPSVPPTGRQLLRRSATSFAISFTALTGLLVASFVRRQLPALNAAGATEGSIREVLLLAVPFTAALTIPMSVFVAVLWEFTRLGAAGALAVARRNRDGMRRLVLPVLAATLGVAMLSFVVTAEIVPRANERLVTVLARGVTAPSDRTMTLAELRAAARAVQHEADRPALVRAARYEVEIQKKFALPAACVVLALVAMTLALSLPRGGATLVVVASLAVFGAYYLMIVTGESLADRLVVSPFIAMWGANALLLAIALLAMSKRRAFFA